MPELPLPADSVLVDAESAVEQRAARIWRFVLVMFGTWSFFACFMTYRGYDLAANICILETLVYSCMILVCRNVRPGQWLTRLNLAVSGVGLFAVSVSDPALSRTLFFFPASIFIASQLHGVRVGTFWMFTSLAAITGYFFVTCGPAVTFQTVHLDRYMLTMGVAVCIYFCCQQAEEYYRLKTNGLIQLSHRLEERSRKLNLLATTDSLTGLLNRFEFQNRLEAAVSLSQESAADMALYLIDMDGFKGINDSLGHAVGDDALVEIAVRLRSVFGERADVARLGGDEFCLICPNVEGKEAALEIAREIWLVLTQRYALDSADFQLGASIGFALSPFHASTSEELLAFADAAMFFAKERQMGTAQYDHEMTEELAEYREMQDRLIGAVARDEFFLLYQPQVDLASGRMMGVEALIRWRQDGQVVGPDKFIPVLEVNREIFAVGQWVIRECCKQWAEWKREGFETNIAINISTLQFGAPDFIDRIVEDIEEFGVDPTRIDFEITEGLLVEDVDEARSRLTQLRDMGATVSLDDFGTGYSSLSYLRELPIDRLKIDRSFIRNIPTHDEGVIASSIILLAKTLGMKVLAEGVENEDQLDFLAAHDCDEYQGHLYSRPITAEEVLNFADAIAQTVGAAD